MSKLNNAQKRRLRGKILELVYENHEAQMSRYDDVSLLEVLHDLRYQDVSLNALITCLQEMKDRGYLVFALNKDMRTGDVDITQIEITPAGRDLKEGLKTDAAVTILLN